MRWPQRYIGLAMGHINALAQLPFSRALRYMAFVLGANGLIENELPGAIDLGSVERNKFTLTSHE